MYTIGWIENGVSKYIERFYQISRQKILAPEPVIDHKQNKLYINANIWFAFELNTLISIDLCTKNGIHGIQKY